jgi:hypothetical protein
MQAVTYSSWLLPGLGGCDGFFTSGIAQLQANDTRDLLAAHRGWYARSCLAA